MDQHAYELACRLGERQWVFTVKPKHESRNRKDRDDTAPVPTTYVQGVVKLWWVTAHQKRLAPMYLRALLLYDGHKQPVPHFKTEKFYRDLIDGARALLVCTPLFI